MARVFKKQFLEALLRRERQADGIAKALEKGVKFGAKEKLTKFHVQQMNLDRDAGVTIRDLCCKTASIVGTIRYCFASQFKQYFY